MGRNFSLFRMIFGMRIIAIGTGYELHSKLVQMEVIVTARNDNVALIMRSVHTHRLEQLSFEDCW